MAAAPPLEAARPTLDLDDGGSNEHHVHDHSDDRDDHVARSLAGLEVSPERRQHPQQDRKDRDREADEKGSRSSSIAAVEHRKQRPEQRGAKDDCDGEA